MMPNPILGLGSTSGPWGQAKKTETQPSTGTTDTSTTTETTSSPTSGGTATESAAPPESATPVDSGATTAPAQGGGGATSSATANQVSPMPDSLRQLIADYGRKDGPALTALHALSQRLAEAHEKLPEMDETLELVQRTRAEIVAAASMLLRAQATQTQQSVLAILQRE